MIEPTKPEDVILDAALAMPAAERGAYLDRACADNPDLRQLVQALLRAYEMALRTREAQPARPVDPTMVVSIPPAGKTGDRIGRYKLLQQVGEGGWGVVYMAEQEEPVRRRVALKVIKPGMDTKQVLARFEAERQALALMDHPNIAKVLDAGATETGRPYFIMELVRGIKITDYCDQNNLPTAKRLDLFIQVCKAIQHAHQKGIIHRDIKPSNILVTLHDGVAVPKVIDFGIAKATEQRLTDKTLFTALEQFIGTPAYMSPEQAEMSGLDIDTRSDIYSLGVLLYELLTGRTPFDPKEMAAAGLDGVRRLIREKEPVRPSTRLSSLTVAEQTALARCRQLDPPKLIHIVRGDLDWIAMKCLEKDRSRRYETAAALAMDLQRHLVNEPVVARPPSRAYRFQKLVHRNKLAFACAAAVVAALAIGLTVSLRLLMAERAARRQAGAEAAKSKQAFLLLSETFAGVDPATAQGLDTTLLRMILTNASRRFDLALTNQPDSEAELRLVLMKAFTGIGQHSNALEEILKVVKLRRAGGGPTNVADAEALANLAVIYTRLGNLSAAEDAGRQALRVESTLLGEESPKLATALDNLSVVLCRETKLDEAEQMMRRAYRIRTKVLPPDHPEVSRSRNNLAYLLAAEGDFDAAEEFVREALAAEIKAGGRKDEQLACQNNLATLLARKGALEAALGLHEKTLAQRLEMYHSDHEQVAYSLTQTARMKAALGDLAGAEAMLLSARAMQERLDRHDHEYVADTLLDLGTVLLKKGDLPSAETNLTQALVMRQKMLGPENSDVADAQDALALFKMATGDLGGANKLLEDALALSRKVLPANHPDLVAVLLHLAWVLDHQGQRPRADELRGEGLALAKQRQLCGAEAAAEALWDLADALQAQRNWGEAEPLLKEADQLCQTALLSRSIIHRHVLQRGLRLYDEWQAAAPGSVNAAEVVEWKRRLAECPTARDTPDLVR